MSSFSIENPWKHFRKRLFMLGPFAFTQFGFSWPLLLGEKYLSDAPSKHSGFDAPSELGSVTLCPVLEPPKVERRVRASCVHMRAGGRDSMKTSAGWSVILILHLISLKGVEFSICILQEISHTYGAEVRLTRCDNMLSLVAFIWCLSHRNQKAYIHPVYKHLL